MRKTPLVEEGVLNIVVIGMGYVGIPCAALLADVPGFRVTGVQRLSERSGWKIECLNAGNSPFEGEEPGLVDGRNVFDAKTCRTAGMIYRGIRKW